MNSGVLVNRLRNHEKMVRRCSQGTCYNDSRYPVRPSMTDRFGKRARFIHFLAKDATTLLRGGGYMSVKLAYQVFLERLA